MRVDKKLFNAKYFTVNSERINTHLPTAKVHFSITPSFYSHSFTKRFIQKCAISTFLNLIKIGSVNMY